MKPIILIVDDEGDPAPALIPRLEPLFQGRALMVVHSVQAAREALTHMPIVAVISDVFMPEENGFVLAAFLRNHRPELPFIMISSHVDTETRESARAHGARVFLTKPLNWEHVAKVVNGYLKES